MAKLPARDFTKGPALLADYLTEREAAVELLQSLRTVRLWRQQRRGPCWTKIGRRVLYSRASLMNWISRLENKAVPSNRGGRA
jgi:hypothetical protein